MLSSVASCFIGRRFYWLDNAAFRQPCFKSLEGLHYGWVLSKRWRSKTALSSDFRSIELAATDVIGPVIGIIAVLRTYP